MFGKDFGKGFSEGERNMNGNSYFNEQTLLRLKDHRRLIKKIIISYWGSCIQKQLSR